MDKMTPKNSDREWQEFEARQAGFDGKPEGVGGVSADASGCSATARDRQSDTPPTDSSPIEMTCSWCGKEEDTLSSTAAGDLCQICRSLYERNLDPQEREVEWFPQDLPGVIFIKRGPMKVAPLPEDDDLTGWL